MVSVGYFTIHSGIAWIEFLNSTDDLGDILCHLREGDMKGAQLLWLRYEVIIISPHLYVETFRTSLNPPVKSKTVVIVSGMALRCVAMFCDRARLQPSSVRAALKPSSVPSQRTCPHRISACGSRQFLFPL